MNRIIGLSLALTFSFGMLLTSCKNKNPSVVKIFVRSYNQELLKDAKVILISNPNIEPVTPTFVDTLLTNESGFAQFNLEEVFDQYGKKDEMVANFDIVVKKNTKEGVGTIRARAHITAVETITMEQ